MAGRSPARFLAPLALVAFAVALFVVVTGTPRPGDRSSPNRTRTAARPPTPPTGDGTATTRQRRAGATRSSRATRRRRSPRRPACRSRTSCASTPIWTRRRSAPGQRIRLRAVSARSPAAVAAGALAARRRAPRAAARRLPGRGPGAERDRDRGLDRHVACEREADARAGRLRGEADDRAAHARAAPTSTTATRRPLRPRGDRVARSTAAGRADDGSATCCAACCASPPTTRR